MLAVEHLASLGRKRIAHVTGPEHFEAVRLRRNGYLRRACRRRADALDGFYLLRNWSEAWGREAAPSSSTAARAARRAVLRQRPDRPRHGRRAARTRHRRAGDVAIVGFDNWDVMAVAARPPLTSIDMNLKALGREAGDRLIDMIAGKRASGVQRRPCSLVVRESSGG